MNMYGQEKPAAALRKIKCERDESGLRDTPVDLRWRITVKVDGRVEVTTVDGQGERHLHRRRLTPERAKALFDWEQACLYSEELQWIAVADDNGVRLSLYYEDGTVHKYEGYHARGDQSCDTPFEKLLTELGFD